MFAVCTAAACEIGRATGEREPHVGRVLQLEVHLKPRVSVGVLRGSQFGLVRGAHVARLVPRAARLGARVEPVAEALRAVLPLLVGGRLTAERRVYTTPQDPTSKVPRGFYWGVSDGEIFERV